VAAAPPDRSVDLLLGATAVGAAVGVAAFVSLAPRRKAVPPAEPPQKT
jgi:hypothetical protein